MDYDYPARVKSSCFVWGTFIGDRSLSTTASNVSRRLAAVEESRILVPREAKPDDTLVAVLGSSCLFLLRPLEQKKYKFLGPVIRGIDNLPDWERQEKKMQTFILV
jgi:hypothetical protein